MDAKNEKYKLESDPEKDYISADENILTQKWTLPDAKILHQLSNMKKKCKNNK